MKILWFLGLFVFSMVLTGCSEKEKVELNQTKEELVEETDTRTPAQTEKPKEETGNVKAEVSFQEKVNNGEIILLTVGGEPEPYKFGGGSKITTMKLPDGKLYQVREDGNRTMFNVPGKGEMGIIMLNDKFYLFDDDDQAYEVKFDNNQLYAEKTELIDIILSKK
jgi:hypothetical protein